MKNCARLACCHQGESAGRHISRFKRLRTDQNSSQRHRRVEIFKLSHSNAMPGFCFDLSSYDVYFVSAFAQLAGEILCVLLYLHGRHLHSPYSRWRKVGVRFRCFRRFHYRDFRQLNVLFNDGQRISRLDRRQCLTLLSHPRSDFDGIYRLAKLLPLILWGSNRKRQRDRELCLRKT
jgi:hypothetical protein